MKKKKTSIRPPVTARRLVAGPDKVVRGSGWTAPTIPALSPTCSPGVVRFR